MNHRSAGHSSRHSSWSRRALLRSVIAGAVFAATVTIQGCGSGDPGQPEALADRTHASQLAERSLPNTDPRAGGLSSSPAADPAADPTAAGASAPPAAGPSPAVGQQPAAAPEPAQARTIMVIRHGEKPSKSGTGIDPAGRPDSHSLTQRGWSRANYLPDIFGGSGPLRPGLAKPTVIYAAHANGLGEGTRTRETVRLVSSRLNVPIDTSFGKGDEAALARQAAAAAEKGPVLVCWQHGEIPAIASALKVVGPQPPKTWPDDRYDMVWTFTETPQGWTFSQVPEMVLAGDSAQTFR